MKGDRNLKQVKKTIVCLVWLVALTLIPAVRAEALDTSVELTVGYDDNVPASSDATESGFAFYRAELLQQFFSDHPAINSDIFIEGDYYDFFQVSDRYELKAGVSFGLSLMDGRLVPGIISEGLIYRDEYMEADDCDEIMAGGRLKWLFSEQMMLEARQTWRRTDYKEPAVIGPDPRPDTGPGYYGEKTDDPPPLKTIDIEERVRSTGLQLVVYLASSIQAELMATYNRLTSSMDADAYREKGLSISLLWMPSSLWEISAMTGWGEVDYDHDPPNTDWTENIFDASFGISRFIDPFELFFKVERTENDSSLDGDSYRQTVTQCGVILSF